MTSKTVKELVDQEALAIGKLYRASRESYLEAGRRLLAKKKSLRHGEWLPWLKANRGTLGFEERAAQRLMEFARNPSTTTYLPFLDDDADRKATPRDKWGNAPWPERCEQREYSRPEADADEYYTDGSIITRARKALGSIDLDPASCLAAQRTVKATKFYDKQVDGLEQPWKGRIWLNPPFTLVESFIDKLALHIENGMVTSAIVVTPSATDTAWFHRLSKHASRICFPRGRLKYTPGSDLTTQHPGKRGHAISYVGPNPDRFKKEFADIGFVMKRA